VDVVAEVELFAVYADGEGRRVVLRLGRPQPHPDLDWFCPVQGEGLRLWQGPTDMRGLDGWHSLMLAQRFLRQMLAAEVERGATFHWPGGEHAVTVDELFVLHEIT